MVNQLETELVKVARQLRSLTVKISDCRSRGSGLIWSADGLIVTNAHVIHASKIKIELENETIARGTVIAYDAKQDLAAIKIEANNLPTPTMANLTNLRPGEIVLAMGNPWGFGGTLTTGILYAVNDRENLRQKLPRHARSWYMDNDPSIIVADIRLAPGNSGGVLADAQGSVIGINTAIVNGLAWAISVEQIQNFVRANIR